MHPYGTLLGLGVVLLRCRGQAPTGDLGRLAGRAPRLTMSVALGTMMNMTVARSSPDAAHQAVVEGVLERITYANEDTGYTIARLATERSGPDLVTVVGPLLGAQIGESLRLTGQWGHHAKYGKQFQVPSFPNSSRG